jgi:hypothetical protein
MHAERYGRTWPAPLPLSLYFIAGLYEATLERPFVKWLRARTEPWLEQQQATTGNPLLLSPTFSLRG